MLTDSGGIQEEAAILGKPVLILRKTTERDEIIDEGIGCLVGVEVDTIINAVQELLINFTFYNQMARCSSIYEDGQSAKKIVNILEKYFTQ